MGWAERAKGNGAADAPAYANRVDVLRGSEEVVLVFSFQRADKDQRLIAEVALSPAHAERLGSLLASHAAVAPAGAAVPDAPLGWIPPIHS